MANNAPVSIYTTPTCHFCHAAKEFFAANGVTYTEHNVASDLEKRKEMIETSGNCVSCLRSRILGSKLRRLSANCMLAGLSVAMHTSPNMGTCPWMALYYNKQVRRYPIETINSVKKDRAKGTSLSQLMAKYQMSKTNVWHHVRRIHLSPEKRKAIRSYLGGSRAEKVREWERARREASSILEKVNIKSAWPILYAALYWSEGTKSSFVFTNTDERMIRVFLFILRTYLGVKNDALDFMIRTCVPMNASVCRKYWAGVANVPMSQIRINHNDTHNKSNTEYGMCRITLKRGAYHLKLVHCLFRSVADKMLFSGSRSSTDRTSHS
jgi:hypothetical protein